MPPPESARMRTLRRRCRGSWASASRVVSTWSAAVFEPALQAGNGQLQRLKKEGCSADAAGRSRLSGDALGGREGLG